MEKRATMTKYTVCGLLLATSLAVQAEPMALRCGYTQATYDAAYMSQPETRDCPTGRCYYDIRFDSAGAMGSVNGVDGYALTVSDASFQLDRQAHNIVVGGTDTASFTINRDDLSYQGSKTTPPGVTVMTQGQCQPL